jgi:hypothetical protein
MLNISTLINTRDQIARDANNLVRAAEDGMGRYQVASSAGAALAAEVYRFTEDPDGVGLDALKSAYSRFMRFHSGNFTPTPEEDPYTSEIALCDDDGIVRGGAMHHGTDYRCTGHAHFSGEHIRCTNPAHSR